MPADAERDSLLGLYRAAQLSDLIAPAPPVLEATPAPKIDLVLDREKKSVKLGDIGALFSSGFRLVDSLAATHLAALGHGRAPKDMPFMTAAHLVDELGFAEEASVRRSIKITRAKIARLSDAAGLPPLELIESSLRMAIACSGTGADSCRQVTSVNVVEFARWPEGMIRRLPSIC